MKTTALFLIATFFFPVAWGSSPFQTFQEYVAVRNQVNQRPDLDVIQFYHQTFHPVSYAVLDKKMNTLTVYSPSGSLQSSQRVQTASGDELKKGGAGMYKFKGLHEGFGYAQAEKDESLRRLFQGSVSLEEATPLYVLPESDLHKFRIRNERLIFNAARVFRNRPEFNYSPTDERIRFSRFTVTLRDAFTKRYVRALQVQKPLLMQLLKIDNDEFNMLAEFAFGVLSPETDFGNSWKYQIKQSLPTLVAIFKGNGLDTSANSRGPTQIKRIPQVILEHFQITKDNLKVPENAAITTVAFVAEQIKELRNMAHLHPLVNEETLQDYLYYLYQGRRFKVREGNAVPEENAAIQKIKAAMEFLTIEDAPY